MAKTIETTDATMGPDPIEAIPPPQQLLVLGFQHVLVMYAGAVAVPLIIGRALKLPPEQVAMLVSADLFACGLATLVQTLGLFGIGIRLPVMMGVTFASVAPMLAMIAAGAAAGASSAATLQVIYGAVIAAGVFGFLAAGFIGRLVRLFPPLVTGTVILVIGISLMRIGVDWAAGGQASAPDYGAPIHLGIALFVLLVILGLTRFGKGFVGHIAILLGLAAGAILTSALGLMHFDRVAAAPWFGFIRPLAFGAPVFEPASILNLCLVMLVVMIESMGMFLAVGRMTGRPADQKALIRGLRADGVGAVIGGLFNTFPYTSFSQNVGLVGVTGVRSRFVCAAAGGLMIILGLSPKLGALVEAVPQFVLGGAGLVMFGVVAATGVRILSTVDFSRRANLFVLAISIGMGMIPLVAPKFFQFMPPSLAPLLNSGIVLATAGAVLLNLYYNGLGSTEAATETSSGDTLH